MMLHYFKNTCLANVSQNYWNTKNDVTLLNTCLANVSFNYWKTNASLNTVLSNYITNQPISISTANASIRNIVCPAGSISVSTTDGGADKAIQVFNNTGAIFLSPGNGTTGNYNPTTIAGDNVLGYYGTTTNTGTGTLNITQWGPTSNGIRLNGNTVTITDTLNVTSTLNVASNAVATQSWVQGQNYLTSQPVSISTANACITNCSVTNIYSTGGSKLYSKTTVRKDCSGFSYTNNQFEIAGLTNPNCKIRMCVDTTSNVGYIGTANEYISWMPL